MESKKDDLIPRHLFRGALLDVIGDVYGHREYVDALLLEQLMEHVQIMALEDKDPEAIDLLHRIDWSDIRIPDTYGWANA